MGKFRLSKTRKWGAICGRAEHLISGALRNPLDQEGESRSQCIYNNYGSDPSGRVPPRKRERERENGKSKEKEIKTNTDT